MEERIRPLSGALQCGPNNPADFVDWSEIEILVVESATPAIVVSGHQSFERKEKEK